MNVGGTTKIFLALAAAVAVLIYLVIVDLGIHAGRIHRGVDVAGVDVGGLTVAEAQEVLTERGRDLRRGPVVFTAPGFDCRFIPGQLGWRPHPTETVKVAMEVGRSGGWVQSALDRARAWISGVTVDWAQGPESRLLSAFVNGCVELGEQQGVRVDREALRDEARAVISQWPRQQVHDLPLEQ